MDRYIGLDAHSSSCRLGVLGPGGKRLGLYTIFTGGRWMTLRLDFPFWVNKPLPDENELRFRWVFGFEQAF